MDSYKRMNNKKIFIDSILRSPLDTLSGNKNQDKKRGSQFFSSRKGHKAGRMQVLTSYSRYRYIKEQNSSSVQDNRNVPQYGWNIFQTYVITD